MIHVPIIVRNSVKLRDINAAFNLSISVHWCATYVELSDHKSISSYILSDSRLRNMQFRKEHTRIA